MTKTYFRFDLPKENGYSPNWCGSGYMGNIRNHKVLFYDEQEGYGVASCDTAKTELDPNLTAITEKTALSLLAKLDDKQNGVYMGADIRYKWDKRKEKAPVIPIEYYTGKVETEEEEYGR